MWLISRPHPGGLLRGRLHAGPYQQMGSTHLMMQPSMRSKRLPGFQGPRPSLISQAGQPAEPASASELLQLQKDMYRRKRSSHAQWALVIDRNQDKIQTDVTLGPAITHQLLVALKDDPEYVTAAKLVELLDLQISLCEEYIKQSVASSFNSDQLQQFLEGAALLMTFESKGDAKWYARVTARRDTCIGAVAEVLGQALPAALTGASVRQVLACMQACSILWPGEPLPPSFQTQLIEALNADKRFRLSCTSHDLVQLIGALRSEQAVPVSVIPSLKAAVDKLGWWPALPSVKGRTRLKGAGGREAQGKGRAGSARGSHDMSFEQLLKDEGLSADQPAELMPTDACTVTAFLLQLHQQHKQALSSEWLHHLAVCTLQRASQAADARGADELVLLCQALMDSLYLESPQPVTLVDSICVAVCQQQGAFSSQHFPGLLKQLVAEGQRPDLCLPTTFLQALANHYVQSALSASPLASAVGKQAFNSPDSTSLHTAILDSLHVLSQPVPASGPASNSGKEAQRSAAVSACKLVLDEWEGRLSKSVQRNTLPELIRLPQLALSADTPLTNGVQRLLEQQLLECKGIDKPMAMSKVLLPLAYANVAPLDPHTLDVFLPSLDVLVAEVSPYQMTRLLSALHTAGWLGRSPMRDRLLAAAHQLLPKCTSVSELQALIQAAGQFASVPVEGKATRLAEVSYDVEGSIALPTSQDWLAAIEMHASVSKDSLAKLTPGQRIWILYSLCVHLQATLSPAFICDLLLPLAISNNKQHTFEACRPHDFAQLLELVQHWHAAPAEHDWLLRLVQETTQCFSQPGVEGIVLGKALDCLPCLLKSDLGMITAPAITLGAAAKATDTQEVVPHASARETKPQLRQHDSNTDVVQQDQSQGAQTSARTAQHSKAVAGAVRQLGTRVMERLLTAKSMQTLAKQPVLLAVAPDRLLALGVKPDVAWLKDFCNTTQGSLAEVSTQSPAVLVRMLWSVQQLGYTPELQWVFMVVSPLQPQLNRLARSHPSELATLLAALHACLTDPSRPAFLQEQPMQEQASSSSSAKPFAGKRSARKGQNSAPAGPQADPLYGTPYSTAAVQLATQAAEAWLRASSLQPALLSHTPLNVLLLSAQAMVSMLLPEDDPLLAMLPHRLPVSPNQKGKGAGKQALGAVGRAGQQPGQFVVRALGQNEHSITLWVVNLCSALRSQQLLSSSSATDQLSAAVSVLAIQRAAGNAEVTPEVNSLVQQALLKAVQASTTDAKLSAVLHPASLGMLLDACIAPGGTVSASLAGAYLDMIAVQQGSSDQQPDLPHKVAPPGSDVHALAAQHATRFFVFLNVVALLDGLTARSQAMAVEASGPECSQLVDGNLAEQVLKLLCSLGLVLPAIQEVAGGVGATMHLAFVSDDEDGRTSDQLWSALLQVVYLSLQQSKMSGTDKCYQETLGLVCLLIEYELYVSNSVNTAMASSVPQLQDLLCVRACELFQSDALSLTQQEQLLRCLSMLDMIPSVALAKAVLSRVRGAILQTSTALVAGPVKFSFPSVALTKAVLSRVGGADTETSTSFVVEAVKFSLGVSRPVEEMIEIEQALSDAQVKLLIKDVLATQRRPSLPVLVALAALAVRTLPPGSTIPNAVPALAASTQRLGLPQYTTCMTEQQANTVLAQLAELLGTPDGFNITEYEMQLLPRCFAAHQALDGGVDALTQAHTLFSTSLKYDDSDRKQGAVLFEVAVQAMNCGNKVDGTHLLNMWLAWLCIGGKAFAVSDKGWELLTESIAHRLDEMTPDQVMQAVELVYIEARMLNQDLYAGSLGHVLHEVPHPLLRALREEMLQQAWPMEEQRPEESATSFLEDYLPWIRNRLETFSRHRLSATAVSVGQRITSAAVKALPQVGTPGQCALSLEPSPTQPISNIRQLIPSRDVSIAQLAGGPYIAGEFDEVWRWSLVCGLMQLFNDKKESHPDHRETTSRYTAAVETALKSKPRAEAVLQWIAPLFLTDLTKPVIKLPAGMNIRKWLEAADWRGILTQSVHLSLLYDVHGMMLVCPEFKDMFLQLVDSQRIKLGLPDTFKPDTSTEVVTGPHTTFSSDVFTECSLHGQEGWRHGQSLLGFCSLWRNWSKLDGAKQDNVSAHPIWAYAAMAKEALHDSRNIFGQAEPLAVCQGMSLDVSGKALQDLTDQLTSAESQELRSKTDKWIKS